VQGLLAVANGATEDEEAVVDKPIHERRVLIPGVLLPDLAGGVPGWPVHKPDREMRHGR
jgi:hypothetical protein